MGTLTTCTMFYLYSFTPLNILPGTGGCVWWHSFDGFGRYSTNIYLNRYNWAPPWRDMIFQSVKKLWCGDCLCPACFVINVTFPSLSRTLKYIPNVILFLVNHTFLCWSICYIIDLGHIRTFSLEKMFHAKLQNIFCVIHNALIDRTSLRPFLQRN